MPDQPLSPKTHDLWKRMAQLSAGLAEAAAAEREAHASAELAADTLQKHRARRVDLERQHAELLKQVEDAKREDSDKPAAASPRPAELPLASATPRPSAGAAELSSQDRPAQGSQEAGPHPRRK